MSENIVNKINVNGKEYEVQSKTVIASGDPYIEFNLSTIVLGSGLSVDSDSSSINLDIRGISRSEKISSLNAAQINLGSGLSYGEKGSYAEQININLGSGLYFSKEGSDNKDYINVNIGSGLIYTDSCDGRGTSVISFNLGDGLKINSAGQLSLSNSSSSSSGGGFALSSSNVGKGLSLDYSLGSPKLYLSTIRGVDVGYYGNPSEILLGTGLKFSVDPTMPTKECIEVAIGTGLVMSKEFTIIPDIKGVECMPGSGKMEIKLHPDDFYFDENGYVRIKKS